MAKFSVVIPTFNRATQIVAALDSVRAQDFGDVEIWVIDDGSTDGTEDVVGEYPAEVGYVRQDNAGVAAARNEGIRRSSAEYVAFLDSDDRWLPHKLARVDAALSHRPEAALLFSDVESFDPAGARLWTSRLPRGRTADRSSLLLGNFIATSSAVARRDVLEEEGGFDETLTQAEDWDLWLRVAQRAPLVHIDEILVHRTVDPASLSAAPADQEVSARKVLESALSEVPRPPRSIARKARARLDYAAARAYLSAGDRSAALRRYRSSVRGDPVHARAVLYWLLLETRAFGLLPERLRRSLRVAP